MIPEEVTQSIIQRLDDLHDERMASINRASFWMKASILFMTFWFLAAPFVSMWLRDELVPCEELTLPAKDAK